MTDIDDDYEGDLAPLLADLAALRSALGDSYRAFGDGLPEEDGWQPSPGLTPSGAAETAPPPPPAPRPPRSEPAPLPERLAAVTAALEANQSLQRRLDRLIKSVDRAQDQAVGIRERVRAAQRRRQIAASAPHALGSRRRDQDQATGVSWFWSQPGAPAPPAYPGSSEIRPIIEVLPLVFPHRKWQEDERNALCDGVVQVVQERLLNKLLNDLETAPVPPPGADPTTSQNNATATATVTATADDGGGGGISAGISLKEFEARQAPIRDLTASSPEVIEIAATLTDAEWATVAHRNVRGRTPRECALQWLNAAKPTITHEKFTPEEDAKLEELVDQYGLRSWPRIAAELQQYISTAPPTTQPPPPPLLPTTQPPPPARTTRPTNNTNTATTNANTTTTTNNFTTANGNTAQTATIIKQRTPLACMARHQELVHRKRGTQEFTDADRQRLIQIVNRVGVQWKRVAEEFGGPWNYDQLMHHWRRHAQRHEAGEGTGTAPVAPRRGKWTPEEDEVLLTAVALYGKKWSYVAKVVPGRSDVQCRERYANCLDPGVNKEPWTEQEDVLLRQNKDRFTNQETGKVKWSGLAELIPGRTDYAVKKRWTALTNAESRGAGGGGGGGGRERGQVRGTSASVGAAATAAGSDAAVGASAGAAGPSTTKKRAAKEKGANGASDSGQASGSKKKEPAKEKKQNVQNEPKAPPPTTKTAPPAAKKIAVPPPPPLPTVEEPAPVVTKRGRSIKAPSRLKD